MLHTFAPEGEDLNPKSRQLKFHHVHQVAHAGEGQHCFSDRHQLQSPNVGGEIQYTLWQGPDEDKLDCVEAGGSSECNKCKGEKEVRAGQTIVE